MAITDDQLRAIAFLAVACRPHGARHWDSTHVYGCLAKVRTRSLTTVTQAAVRAAAHRDATPGDIVDDPMHWAEPVPRQGPAAPRRFVRAESCQVCAFHETECRARWADDHDFVPMGYRPETTKRGEALAAMRVAVTAAQVCAP